MLKKPLVIALLAATAVTVTLATPAAADPVLGALLGAGVGAAIGHNVSGRDGAWVGGALGAVAGAAIGSNGYYDRGYYGPSASYYAPAPVYSTSYYAPAPVYVAPPAVVYRAPIYRAAYPGYGTVVYTYGPRHHRYYGQGYVGGRY